RVASPVALLAGLQQQTDLQAVASDVNYTIYLNAAWIPARSALPQSVVDTVSSSDQRSLQQLTLSGSSPVLPGRHPDEGRGPVGPGQVLVSASRNNNWSLRVDGITLHPVSAFGWAMVFEVPPGTHGTAVVSVASSTGLHIAELVELALWAAAVAAIVIDRRRRSRGSRPDETVRADWFVPMTPGAGRGQWRSRGDVRSGLADIDTDEVWDRV
ncbi:MAG: hypothetical protein M3R71_01500, partial [Actinomycetota bacterium]|nr:hypothetical protein [Actinomycetota bacterium]